MKFKRVITQNIHLFVFLKNSSQKGGGWTREAKNNITPTMLKIQTRKLAEKTKRITSRTCTFSYSLEQEPGGGRLSNPAKKRKREKLKAK